MVQILEQPGSLAGRIGRGIGQGLKEQLPKEVERYRLSQGLKSLGEKSFKSPFELAGALYSTPGITPEIAQAVLPYLQTRMAQQQYKAGQPAGHPPETPAGQPGAPASAQPAEGQEQPQAQINAETGEPELQKILTPESTAALQKTIERTSPQVLRDQAYELQRNQPFVYPTVEAAEKEVEKREATRIANEQAKIDAANRQMATRQFIKDEIQDRLNKKLQKDTAGTFTDLSGEEQDALLNQAEDEVARGKLTAQEAINKYSQLGLDLAKSNQNLKTVGSKSWLSTSPATNRKQLSAIRETFKKAGPIALENFERNLKATQNLSDHYSNYLAYPLKENKELNNYVAGIKGRRGGPGIGSRDLENKTVDNIEKMLGNNDSLFTIGLELKRKNLDDTYVMEQIQKDYQEGRLKLNKRQQRELEQYHPVDNTLGDIYLFTLSGLEPVKEVQ